MPAVRVTLPFHLRNLACLPHEQREVGLSDVGQPVTQQSILDALEARYPQLRGTIRDHVTHQRRPFIRFFVCGQDLSNDPPDALLPEKIADGVEPFHVIGAIAGG